MKSNPLTPDLPGVTPEDPDIDLSEETPTFVGKVSESESSGADLLMKYKVGYYYRSFLLTGANFFGQEH